jgi:hypothetical protein
MQDEEQRKLDEDFKEVARLWANGASKEQLRAKGMAFIYNARRRMFMLQWEADSLR